MLYVVDFTEKYFWVKKKLNISYVLQFCEPMKQNNKDFFLFLWQSQNPLYHRTLKVTSNWFPLIKDHFQPKKYLICAFHWIINHKCTGLSKTKPISSKLTQIRSGKKQKYKRNKFSTEAGKDRAIEDNFWNQWFSTWNRQKSFVIWWGMWLTLRSLIGKIFQGPSNNPGC